MLCDDGASAYNVACLSIVFHVPRMDKFPSPNPLALHCNQTEVIYTFHSLGLPHYAATARVFLIRVICSCREICAIKASSARDVNIPYVDATVEVAGEWVVAARPSVSPG